MPEILIRVLSISLKGKRKKGKMIKIEVHRLIPINCWTKLRWKKMSELKFSIERDLINIELCEAYQAAKEYRQYNKIHFKNEKKKPKATLCVVLR